MDRYNYNLSQIEAAARAAGLPITDVRIGADATLDYSWSCTPTDDQFAQMAEIVAGNFGSAPVELSWDDIRAQRNKLLAACDWTQIGDNSLTAELRQAWQDYRNALRDIPQLYVLPEEVVWPTPPG